MIIENKKRYFGSLSLRNTIQKIRESYPDCEIRFIEEGDERKIELSVTPEKRKEYKLSENKKTYRFLNGHLILKNGNVDPFKYDSMDRFIEETELMFDIEQKRSFIIKTETALNACKEFCKNETIWIGNVVNEDVFDIRLNLNGIDRVYRNTGDKKDSHLQKLDPDTILKDEKACTLSQLKPEIRFRILKTTHPGLLTAATEYISGIIDNKLGWSGPEDAYVKKWEIETYKTFGINAFHVLADIPENISIGKFTDQKYRRLILIDGSQYAYRKNPLQIIPYAEYLKERNTVLNEYKKSIMDVCNATGIIPAFAIESMNISTKKDGSVLLMNTNAAIDKIKEIQEKEPLYTNVYKLNYMIHLKNPGCNFIASIRGLKENEKIRVISINENGTMIRLDVDLESGKISDPYFMSSGYRKTILTDTEAYPLTAQFIKLMKMDIENRYSKE